MNNNESDAWPERFRKAQDVNELLALAHRKMQEEQGIHFPLEDEETAEDAAMDLALGFLCNWILLFGPAQIEGRAQIDAALESFIGTLQKIQTRLPTDNEEVRKDFLHEFKRRLIGPNQPLY